MIEFFRKLLMGLAFAGVLSGCPSPPQPQPTPTPTATPIVTGRPPEPVFTDLVLRSADGRFSMNNQPRTVVGGIPCWPTDGTDEKLIVDGKLIPYWWSLTSPEWIDHFKSKGGNAIHLRLGPAATSEACCGMEEVGGPYTADNSDWNPAYWDRLHKVVRHAGGQGFTVEVDVLDGWVIKHAAWGEVKIPWPAPDVDYGYRLPLSGSLKSWFQKVIYETCNYGNVTYEIGNENDLAPTWSPEYEREAFSLIRQLENQVGCNGVVHMVGSNTTDFSGPYDFFASHTPSFSLQPINGRPVQVNEYNPHMSPSSFAARFCEGAAAGQAFWYWRSDGSDAVQDESLNLLKAGCSVAPGCYIPPDGDGWTVIPQVPSTTKAEMDAAKAAVGDVCGQAPPFSLERLAAQLRSQGSCADKMSDSIMIKRTDGLYEEQHAVAYTDGCWSQNPYKNTWRYSGSTAGQCSNPVAPDVSEFSCAFRSGWWDCTPLVTRNYPYCESIGMGEMGGLPRAACPIRNECPDTAGYEGKCEQKIPCENAAMGGYATWQGDGVIEVNYANANHLQAKCPSCTTLRVCNAAGTVCSNVF